MPSILASLEWNEWGMVPFNIIFNGHHVTFESPAADQSFPRLPTTLLLPVSSQEKGLDSEAPRGCMNSLLFDRALGTVGPQVLARAQTTRLTYALQPTNVQFRGPHHKTDENEASKAENAAHSYGVTAIEIDRFEGRYLLSGGADASISIWDLEVADQTSEARHEPVATVGKCINTHCFTWYRSLTLYQQNFART